MGKLIYLLWPLAIICGLAIGYLKFPNVVRWLFNPAPWVSEMQGYVVVMFIIFALGIYVLAQH